MTEWRDWQVNLLYVNQEDQDLSGEIERFLYLLLSERDSTINISHKHMPTFTNHCKFVRSNPYKEWFVITQRKHPRAKVGSLYRSQNDEVGLFILKNYQGQGWGREALDCFLYCCKDRPLYANINPANERSKCFFAARGFCHPTNVYGPDGRLLQVTYVLGDHSPVDSKVPVGERP